MRNDSRFSTLSSASSSSSTPSSSAAALLVLQAARRLHKAALGAAPSQSLPVLRRVLATGSLRDVSLPALHKNRMLVRRKHILRMLAVEAGYESWETYREALVTLRSEELVHFDLVRGQAGYPNLWFASVAAAQAHVVQHGGRMLAVGDHAVVFAV
jgi:hypothetical protein